MFADLVKNVGTARILRMFATGFVVMGLTACEEGGQFNLFQKKDGGATPARVGASAGKTVERDVEAPDVFQANEAGLWDGRPSLGGIWVAHPDVKDPERVIIRNEANGKFVVGALFRRERATPGPRLQVSSDAAEALGLLAGQPKTLNVTALRREAAAQEPVADPALPKPDDVKSTTLDPIAGGAAAAINAAEKNKTPAPKAPAPKPKPSGSAISKPFVQIGIFSVEKNATNTATAMRQAGMVPTVKKMKLKGKTFWRVLVGPAPTASDRAALINKVKARGFKDAYAVSN